MVWESPHLAGAVSAALADDSISGVTSILFRGLKFSGLWYALMIMLSVTILGHVYGMIFGGKGVIDVGVGAAHMINPPGSKKGGA